MIPYNEWLDDAKKLAIGQKKRIRHCFETDAAMDVYNSVDKWSCYCHRCKEGGVMFKEHQTLQKIVQPDRVSSLPADTIHINQASDYYVHVISKFLIGKGCPMGIIPNESIWLSVGQERIMLRQGDICIGRTWNSLRQPKWMLFGNWLDRPRIWWVGTGNSDKVILTEDALSAYKVHKSITLYSSPANVSVAATLGTTISSRAISYIAGKTVLCMYDGDNAGRDGYRNMRRNLNVYGCSVIDCRPVANDPKDMSLAAIFESIEGYI